MMTHHVPLCPPYEYDVDWWEVFGGVVVGWCGVVVVWWCGGVVVGGV